MKWHHRRPRREFFDRNDFQDYLNMSLADLLQEERTVLNQIHRTRDRNTIRYLELDLEAIQRAINEKQPAGSYKAK